MAGERDLVSGVVQLANLLNKRLMPLFERASVTPQQWAVLSSLSEDEAPLTLVALARRLSVTKQNMTGMIARLEQLGLVERHEDPTDLRSSRVTLSRRGRNVVEKLRPPYEQWLRTLGEGAVSERDVQALTRTVNRLIDALEE